MPTVLSRVRALIERLAPASACDECIAERLGLPARERIDHLARELAGSGGFERHVARCVLCDTVKAAIRKR